MKKTNYLWTLTLVIAMFMSLVFVSCDNDDDAVFNNADVAYWQSSCLKSWEKVNGVLNKENTFDGAMKNVMLMFEKNGNGGIFYLEEDGKWYEDLDYESVYTESDKIVLVNIGGEKEVYNVTKKTDSEMVIEYQVSYTKDGVIYETYGRINLVSFNGVLK